MPKRPRQHVIEAKARNRLHDAFESVGWTVEDLNKDYGEDFLVRIFEKGKATPLIFFIQSKATDQIDRFLRRDDGILAFPIDLEHARHWNRFREPLVLTVYDTKSDTTYWEIIQTFFEFTQGLSTNHRKSITLRILLDNKLDKRGINRIHKSTEKRFERFKAQEEGAKILIDELYSRYELKIEYDPIFGILVLPKGKFITDKSSGSTLTAFGRYGGLLQRLAKEHKVKPERIVEASMKLLSGICSVFPKEGIQRKDQEGRVIITWKTVDDLIKYYNRLFYEE